MILTTSSQLRALLERVRTIAVVGASGNRLRPSYTVFSYLRRQAQYEVTPINPSLSEIDGVTAFPSLFAYAQQHGAPDVVDVFRRPSEVMEVVRQALAVNANALWLQYGVVNDEAIALADRAGMEVVVDRCIKVEHARFHGGLSAAGLNSGRISSRRPRL